MTKWKKPITDFTPRWSYEFIQDSPYVGFDRKRSFACSFFSAPVSGSVQIQDWQIPEDASEKPKPKTPKLQKYEKYYNIFDANYISPTICL